VKSDTWLPVAIFAALVLLIATPLLVRHVRESRRPILAEARIVIATDTDPVFREGPRRLAPAEEPAIAVALKLLYPGGRDRWLAPVTALELDGSPTDHVESDRWPERDREVRVFWFTVECSNVGGVVTPDRAARLLRYRPFLAAEMGRSLLASGPPEVHNDDVLGPQPDRLPIDAGTVRLYARVEVFDPEREVRATQSVATAGPERILDPGYAALHRSASFGDGIDPAVGELFNLSGWEVEGGGDEAMDEIGMAAFGLPFAELVDRRIVASSRTFAAVATAGSPGLDEGNLEPAIDLEITDGAIRRAGRELRWGADVRSGDLLVDGGHVTVLAADDGSGTLDVPDTVLHCWRRPPAKTTLGAVLPQASTRLRLIRHGR
jgi:hypothetical protein